MNTPADKHRIVIVGGGAGGLELATRLGDTLGRRGQAEVTLIDKNRTHVWKPKLHEIASGSMDLSAHEVDYLAQAHWHRFRYRIGEMTALDRQRREVRVAPYLDAEGREVTPDRVFGYDTLTTAAEESKNPQRDLPRAILLSLGVSMLLYLTISLVITGVAHYSTLNNDAPVANAFQALGLTWVSAAMKRPQSSRWVASMARPLSVMR